MLNKMVVDAALTGAPSSIAVAVSGTSNSGTVPANTELLALTVTANVNFRIGVGAQTAVTTDPMLTPGLPPVVIKLDPTKSYTIGAILNGNQTGTVTAATLSAFKVMES